MVSPLYKIIKEDDRSIIDFSTNSETSETIDLDITDEERKELKDNYNIDLDTLEGINQYAQLLALVITKLKEEQYEKQGDNNEE